MYDLSVLNEYESRGMSTAFWAQQKPDATAAYDRFGSKTFAEVNANANRIVRLLRSHGVKAGDHIAFLMGNRAEAMEVMAADLRGGYRLTPVNWRLTTEEALYIFDDCDAKALFVEAKFSDALEAGRQAKQAKVLISIGGDAEGYINYDKALAEFDGGDIPDPVQGLTMFYTSGTTGRPKGVYRASLNQVTANAISRYDPSTDVQLCVCPIYHGAGLTLDTRGPMSCGVPVVFLEKWDSEAVLQTIQDRRITHGHLVPIMFQRLLALPKEVRDRYDVSSLKYVQHGAAPCPPDVKRAMIDWWGPVLYEYYGATEGGGGFALDSQEWLRKPGSVGKGTPGLRVKVLDEEGREVRQGEPGRLYFQASSASPFSYYKDPEKTAASHIEGGEYFTTGDVGYFDDEGYLFLTGRNAETIISGGVNIYPQEIDNELLQHPAVADCATVGAPNAEWGEEVKAVVQLKPGHAPSAELAADVVAFARQRLAGFKAPKSVDFVDEIPRNAAGKIERGKVRAAYWQGRKVQI
jgi:long-chain acyl-CoA synthetase